MMQLDRKILMFTPNHAPNHARPGLPINPNPILTPTYLGVTATHYTAAVLHLTTDYVNANFSYQQNKAWRNLSVQ